MYCIVCWYPWTGRCITSVLSPSLQLTCVCLRADFLSFAYKLLIFMCPPCDDALHPCSHPATTHVESPFIIDCVLAPACRTQRSAKTIYELMHRYWCFRIRIGSFWCFMFSDFRWNSSWNIGFGKMGKVQKKTCSFWCFIFSDFGWNSIWNIGFGNIGKVQKKLVVSDVLYFPVWVETVVDIYIYIHSRNDL